MSDLKKFNKDLYVIPNSFTCEMLRIIYFINYKQFKQNIKYEIYKQWEQDFYMENPHTNFGDKPWGLWYINLNPLYEIKLYRFI